MGATSRTISRVGLARDAPNVQVSLEPITGSPAGLIATLDKCSKQVPQNSPGNYIRSCSVNTI